MGVTAPPTFDTEQETEAMTWKKLTQEVQELRRWWWGLTEEKRKQYKELFTVMGIVKP